MVEKANKQQSGAMLPPAFTSYEWREGSKDSRVRGANIDRWPRGTPAHLFEPLSLHLLGKLLKGRSNHDSVLGGKALAKVTQCRRTRVYGL